jgi:small subunit ribosomal protein S2|uniref:Small ribosomal subunit protein uS2c n=2 Tax=Heterosigma akashiwo TaxID=2829 RepID=B2XT77_HETAK|nr:ribosomal protein S2 [Heterosigma akashiwo]ABV65975.1 30S ribosomal protein S2 [Heterosigma akashiwo]ABV70116.1 30S ribosomal protein S2 [Heterosigma akashiwo]BBA18183.1 30S ribosomal protein S2 [Heterosigma akashiwo]BBA18322.1 30S ribosomal protein S2 [Heterosigma akashiwo]BBA18461.1 30S ribosomal protein S2 [Heterosigma akashiwo]|mmetsp:Transcript_32749/g.47917  ORF Transcript_32749/g.47917 Transcript_32749/m.47917 type:complete len:235 (-) Transcript_32749:101-805(-)
MANLSLAQLLEAGVHYGHKSYRWNPKMFPYIYNERDGIHIIDLVQTIHLLKQACDFVNEAASEGKTFLFVGTKRQAAAIIAQEAKRANSYYVNHRWLGGMLTNSNTFSTRIQRLKFLESQEASGYFEKLTKKESALLKKELEKLRKYLSGVKEMIKRPDIIIVVDQKREMNAIKEALKLKIPIISILDTNCDPDLVDIPIPGNDDALRSIKFIIQKLADQICLGQRNKKFVDVN